MIKLINNTELEITIRKLITSMINMDKYLTDVLEYNEKALTGKMEKSLINLLKKYNVPWEGLKQDSRVLTENPYYRNISFNEVNSGDVKYEKAIIKKRTLMDMDFYKPLGKYMFHYNPLGYFEKDMEMPVLKEGPKIWMSPAISEIKTMDDGIKKGHGRCLTMGLGIGVLPYLWLMKDQVSSVTVIEFNQKVIDLFNKYIKPQFPVGKELTIIHGDAFDYYNEEFLNTFDYVYIDFWENTEDGLISYTKLMEQNINLPHIDYWIEDSILYHVKCVVVPYLSTLYEGKSISGFISSLDNDSRNIARKVNRYFKKRTDTITTEDELLSLIHDKSVLRTILSM